MAWLASAPVSAYIRHDGWQIHPWLASLTSWRPIDKMVQWLNRKSPPLTVTSETWFIIITELYARILRSRFKDRQKGSFPSGRALTARLPDSEAWERAAYYWTSYNFAASRGAFALAGRFPKADILLLFPQGVSLEGLIYTVPLQSFEKKAIGLCLTRRKTALPSSVPETNQGPCKLCRPFSLRPSRRPPITIAIISEGGVVPAMACQRGRQASRPRNCSEETSFLLPFLPPLSSPFLLSSS